MDVHFENARRSLQHAQTNHNVLCQTLTSRENEIHRLRSQVLAKDNELVELRKKVEDQKDRFRRLQKLAKNYKGKCEELTKMNEKLETTVASFRAADEKRSSEMQLQIGSDQVDGDLEPIVCNCFIRTYIVISAKIVLKLRIRSNVLHVRRLSI